MKSTRKHISSHFQNMFLHNRVDNFFRVKFDVLLPRRRLRIPQPAPILDQLAVHPGIHMHTGLADTPHGSRGNNGAAARRMPAALQRRHQQHEALLGPRPACALERDRGRRGGR